jgi:phosphoglycolate phosphatase
LTAGKRAVLFDLDGTLLDTLADLGESMNEALGEIGIGAHPLEAYKRFVGDGMRTLALRSLPPERRDQRTVEHCVAAMLRVYGLRTDRKTRPFAGVPELVEELSKRAIPMAILSNKPEDLTRRLVERFFGAGRFAVVAGARGDAPRKPDPTVAVAIAKRLAVEPAEVLYLGDTDTDMRTAVAAGMYPVGALWGFRDAAELSASGARELVRAPADVLALLS